MKVLRESKEEVEESLGINYKPTFRESELERTICHLFNDVIGDININGNIYTAEYPEVVITDGSETGYSEFYVQFCFTNVNSRDDDDDYYVCKIGFSYEPYFCDWEIDVHFGKDNAGERVERRSGVSKDELKTTITQLFMEVIKE